jgi:hypothetical protein
MPSHPADLPPPDVNPVKADPSPKNGKAKRAKAASANGKAAHARVAVPACGPSCTPGKSIKRGKSDTSRFAMTLRLDDDRHFCLKIAAAKTRRTSQDILTAALEHYLRDLTKGELSDCNCLKEMLGGPKTRTTS